MTSIVMIRGEFLGAAYETSWLDNSMRGFENTTA